MCARDQAVHRRQSGAEQSGERLSRERPSNEQLTRERPSDGRLPREWSSDERAAVERRSAGRRRVLGWAAAALAGGAGASIPAGVFAAAARLTAFQRVQQDTVVLHFDFDSVISEADMFWLSDPTRLVIDLPAAELAQGLGNRDYVDGVVNSVRYGEKADGSLRIVVDLRRRVDATHRFVPRKDGTRLLIDLGVKGDPSRHSARQPDPEPAPLRDVVVAIDAGHGGKDPGALGQRQTREKDIVLSVARRLSALLAETRGVRPVLIRDDDVYVGLRERIARARVARADLFVSIHADAVPRAEARGSSVYTLSLDGATSEAAAWLAKSENESAELYGGLALDGFEQGLRQTLLDLAQSSTLEASFDVGAAILRELAKVGSVHRATVEQANFAVLKSPDIPSVLVETAFISNGDEERKLNDPRFQERLAGAIHRGIVSYLSRRAPEGTTVRDDRDRATPTVQPRLVNTPDQG